MFGILIWSLKSELWTLRPAGISALSIFVDISPLSKRIPLNFTDSLLEWVSESTKLNFLLELIPLGEFFLNSLGEPRLKLIFLPLFVSGERVWLFYFIIGSISDSFKGTKGFGGTNKD